MNKEIYLTYQPYQVLIPSFFRGEDNMHKVSKLHWHICKLMFWRYRMNYELNCLVQLNNYTRPKHFTDNWNIPSTWDETMEKLSGLAKL